MKEGKKRDHVTARQPEGPEVRAEKIEETILLSKQAFYRHAEEQSITPAEFLAVQLRFINKSMWVLQIGIYFLLWLTLYWQKHGALPYSGFSVWVPLLGMTLIPELWKNLRTRTIEIENATYFGLKKVYIARVLLIGMTELVLASIFFIFTAATIRISLYEAVINFLVPFNVTCCICFTVLCSVKMNSQLMDEGLCNIWSFLWYRVVIMEKLYRAIALPVWLLLVAVSLIFLVYVIVRAVSVTARYCEGEWLWNYK